MRVEIFEARRLREGCDPQPLTETGVLAFGELVLQQHGKAFLEAQGAGVRIAKLPLDGVEHAGELARAAVSSSFSALKSWTWRSTPSDSQDTRANAHCSIQYGA